MNTGQHTTNAAADPAADADLMIVTLRTGFPRGMAAAQRILFIAKALHRGSISPMVIHTNTSESGPRMRNTEPEGCFEGVPFLYTCGRVDRPNSFLGRRLCTLAGFLRACWIIAEAATTGRLRTVVFYERSVFSLFPIMLLCRLMEVGFAMDVVEWPPAMESTQGLVGRISLRLYRTLALRLTGRLTAISRFLWERISAMGRREGSLMYLPILADPCETRPRRSPVPGRFVISISSGYPSELLLVLQAFGEVRRDFPDSQLHVTGGLKEEDLRRLLDRAGTPGGELSSEGVICRGYLSRGDLLDLYSTSSAAIVALKDDLRSLSRMPTKIADYTFSGMALVTGAIGDVSGIFRDGENAFMYRPGDASSLAASLLRVMDDIDRAEEIGMRGKSLALEHFSYNAYSASLPEFLIGSR